jgi:mannose-6-phosphate isomerase-like protein (cupin superfamily)
LKHVGITAFGINAYTGAEAGQDVVEEHTEERLGHEQLYVVVSGRATFVLDGEEVDASAGSAEALRVAGEP